MRTEPQTQETLRIGPLRVVPMWMIPGAALLALAAVLLLAPQQPAEAGSPTESEGQGSEVLGMEPSDALSDYDNTVLADNPVAYYRLDGTNVTDLSPLNHDGSYVGAIGTTKLPNGEPATVFDGSSQYAEVPDANDLSITATDKLTLEAWMHPDALQFPKQEGTGYVHWMGKGEGGQQEYASRMYSLTNSEDRPNRISGYAFNLSGGEGIGSYFQDPVAVGEWIHYVLVIDTASSPQYPMGYTKIYKNGSQRDQDSLQGETLSIVPGNGTAPFRIGTRDLRSFFKGAIGKVAIYGHELSSSDVLEHYQKMAATSQLYISCPVPTNPNIKCLGTFDDDTMIGTNATYGDCVEPVGCWGDKIYGLAGNDTLNGRGGGDILNGGPGNDKLDGGERKDYFYGVSGNDSINTADKQADNRISCGDGYDTVRYDRYLDVPDGDCERKIVVRDHRRSK